MRDHTAFQLVEYLTQQINSGNATDLEHTSFVIFNLQYLPDNTKMQEDFALLQSMFADLSLDAYDLSAHRYRRYSCTKLLPCSRLLQWISPTTDDNGNEFSAHYPGYFNAEFSGLARHFSPIDEVTQKSDLLTELIWHDFDCTTWSAAECNTPKHIGVHLVTLRVTDDGTEAAASCNRLHQDGETYTFVHLVELINTGGGLN